MAERGGAQIDNDQPADDRERPSEFARRRRRHRQMRRRLMMVVDVDGKLAKSGGEQQQRQMTTMTSGGDNHHRLGLPEAPISMSSSGDLAAEDIDAQLNELRLHDELSRSGGGLRRTVAGQLATTTAPTAASMRMRMITSQAEMQQQQQRQRELDNRLGGSGAGAVVVAATTAEYNNRDQPGAQQHPQQLVGEQQQQVPLLVDSSSTNQYHDHLSNVNPNQNQYQHHDQYGGASEHVQQPVVFYPNNQQQGGGYLLEDPQPPDAPLTSLLDLDEGAHNQQQQQLRYSHTSHEQHQQQPHTKQEQTGGRLPESVIQVNNWHERKLSSYDQFYGNSSGSGGRLHSQSVELTTLNSVAAASIDRTQQQQQQQPHLVVHHPTGGHLHLMTQNQQHRRNDSTSSFNLSLNDSTGSMLGSGSAVTYGRAEQLDCYHSSTTTTSALVEPGAHDLYEEEDDEDEDELRPGQRPLYGSGAGRTRHRTATSNRARASSGQSRGRRHQQAGTPTGSDDADELKVCEWHGCGNSFLDMRDFVRHLEERHVNMEPAEKNRFFCMWAECKRNNQEFNARYKLLIHMRVHSGEKPFTCDQSPHCKKSFSRLENLKIHKRSHTGEKPYRCNYEHCSKSFTNSSDRIKHHKTHKDPKPYTCSHEGCTKRYTDPSSLRKHLRAHKRHSDGPEVMDHRHLHAASSSYNLGHQNHESYQPHHSQYQQQHSHQELSFSASYQTAREHMTPPQQQQQLSVDNYAQQQQQYSFVDQHQQPSYGAESYTTLEPHNKQMYEQQQQQPYLQADYDPTKELESVLLGASDTSTLTQQDDQLLSASFKRPQHRTDLTTFGPTSQPEQQQQGYLAVPSGRQHRISATFSMRSPSSQRSFSEAQARQHERLSRSWCVGNSARSAPTARRQHLVPSGAPPSQHQNHYHIKQTPDQFGPQAQPYEWPATVGHQPQVSVGQSFTPCDASNYQMTQQQPPVPANRLEQQWPAHYDGQVVAAAAGGQPAARTNQRVQFQPHQQQQQQSRHLTRQQQHEQLMRSMPANVNFL